MTGVLFSSSTGARFFVPCTDPEKTVREMATASYVYGPGWGSPTSKLEYVKENGDGYELIRPLEGWKAE